MRRNNLVKLLFQLQDLLQRDFHVAGLALRTAHRLVNHDTAVLERRTLALGAGAEQKGTHRGSKAHAHGVHIGLDVLHRENLDGVLQDFGVSTSGVSAEELEWLNRAWHRLDPWPDTIPGLIRLKAKHFIAPLSNGNILLLANMAKRAGMPWDAILGAEAAQAYKPQPETYLRTCEILGLQPAQVALVAAHNGDLAAARKCGLATAFVLRPTEHGADQATDTKAEQDWGAIATSFEDLADKLGC